MMAPTSRGRAAAISAMPRYRPHRPPTAIDLSDNTSLWGPAPSARTALRALSDAQLSRYPSPYADELTAALAAHHGVAEDRIATGCGSDDVLDSAIRACCDAGATIGVAVPTFSVVTSFAAVNEVTVTEVPLRRDGSVLAADLLATGAELFYLCSPNNPTGTVLDHGELRTLLAGTRATVLLDEAYVDFADHDASAMLDEFDNLVIVRTLSKAYGLAGLRVGYAIGSPEVIGAIAISRGPYKVGALAEAVAVAVLRDDGTWVTERVAEVRWLRDGFAERLRAAGLEVVASAANFVAVLVSDAAGVFERMLDDGVLVRAYSGLPAFGDLIRITIGPEPLLDEAFEAIVTATR